VGADADVPAARPIRLLTCGPLGSKGWIGKPIQQLTNARALRAKLPELGGTAFRSAVPPLSVE
jgi:hypothetical protein